MVNLEKRTSQAASFYFRSFVKDEELAIGVAEARKRGTGSLLCFSTNNHYLLRAAKSRYSYDRTLNCSRFDWS